MVEMSRIDRRRGRGAFNNGGDVGTFAGRGDIRAANPMVAGAPDWPSQPPPNETWHVKRCDLLAGLAGADEPIILLHAPPGYGKTIALGQYCRAFAASGDEAIWLTADNFDRLDRSTLRGAEPVLICIDAADRLDADQIAKICTLSRERASGMRIVLAARIEHPLVDALGSRLAIFDQDALCFSEGEVALMMAGVPTPAPGVVESSEGWPLALDLLRRASARPGAPVICDLVGEVPALGRFFEHEVLATLPDDALAVLYGITVIESGFSVQSVIGLTGDAMAWRRIERVAEAGLFVTRLSDRLSCYRLHPLFAAFLRDRAIRTGELDMAGLHRRASDWFRVARDWGRAIHHAALAGDNGAIIEIASAAGGWTMLCSGHLRGVQIALERLPPTLLRASPQLHALQIVSETKAGSGRLTDQ
jgi:ATP/maltotriose-dependent transcriptional regulator MalT